METTAVRLYAKNDLRLEKFPLPEIQDDEILMEVLADSLCMSSWKAALAGADHKRVPNDIAENPIIVGHEMSGRLVKIGSKWANKFEAGQTVTIQPALNYQGSMDSPGYSYKYCGGEATYVILPREVMLVDALLPVKANGFFMSALSEPYSCVIGAARSMFRSSRTSHSHEMGLKKGGRMAILGGCGPMGLAAIDYALSCPFRPSKLVVTDRDSAKLARARAIFEPVARERGIDLAILDPSAGGDEREKLAALSNGELYDDIMEMVPVPAVLELAESLLAFNGCLNFFAGPLNSDFYARVNYYDIHYMEKHVIGTTGGNTDDQREALRLMEDGLIRPEALVTHVGGLDSSLEATLHLPDIGGGKKLIYTHKKMPLFALEDLPSLASTSPFFAGLAPIVARSGGLWSKEAEDYVFDKAPDISTDPAVRRKEK